MAPETEILDLIEKFYGNQASSLGRIVEGIDDADAEAASEDSDDVEHLKDLASEAPVIRLVNLLISRAIESRASDIHIEPFERDLKVRYRIDGVLYDVESPPKRLRAAIISRIKIMAKLNIAERRIPQDGRIKMRVLGKDVDLRVSTLPTMYGESVVMRILDKSNTQIYDMEKLGLSQEMFCQIEDLVHRPYGIILVTGPTGSGKTTTLYAALTEINLPDKKIITIEDPVEYQINGVNQIHVNPQIGLTFAAGLRSIVRQDPDVIMVGEMRDLETAEIGIRCRTDRPPRFQHPAHQRCSERHRPAGRHGRRGLPSGVFHPRHPRPTPGSRRLPALQGRREGGARRSCGAQGSR